MGLFFLGIAVCASSPACTAEDEAPTLPLPTVVCCERPPENDCDQERFSAEDQGCSPFVTIQTEASKRHLCWREQWPDPDPLWCSEWCKRKKIEGESRCHAACNYADLFKLACPQAYSWQFDDFSSTYTCKPAHAISHVVSYYIRACPLEEADRSACRQAPPPTELAALADKLGLDRSRRHLVVDNRLGEDVYPALQAWRGEYDPASGTTRKTDFVETESAPSGFHLPAGSMRVLTMPTKYVISGRLWFRTDCAVASNVYPSPPYESSSGLLCATGHCQHNPSTFVASGGGVRCGIIGGAPPTTAVEFTFVRTSADDVLDYYDVSQVRTSPRFASYPPYPFLLTIRYMYMRMYLVRVAPGGRVQRGRPHGPAACCKPAAHCRP